jgi:protein-disulfide isomerase-like protein with CxxC motif
MKIECETIQTNLEMPISEQVELVIERGNELAVIIARTGYMLAQAKNNMNEKMQSEVMNALRRIAKETPFATSRTVNSLVDTLCREERFLVDWIERLNRTATHQLDWCRTLVSKAKQDQYYSTGINNQRQIQH